MSVELRCPDCRAKLRLPTEPEPGTEVECPECNAIFPAPDLETGEAPARRARKASRSSDEDEAPQKKPDASGDAPPRDPNANVPRKRRAKKKETNRTAMTLVVVGGVVFVALVVSLLVWFFTRKPPALEMIKYLPDDAVEASGLNLGHMHKYSELIKVVEPTYKEQGFQKAIDALAKVY